MAQQFGSAFISAGRLAGQLVKGLVNPSALQLRRSEKPSSERVAEGKGEAHAPEAEHTPGEAGDQSPIMSAFAALKRTRLFRFRKTLRKGRGGAAEVGSQIVLLDDYNEKERDHQRARNYLGDDQEESNFDQSKREALFLLYLENQGEPPTRVARYLNSLLGMKRDREFKHLLADQVKPQMDAMAGRIYEIPTDERRSLAALISRAAYQVGVRSSQNFARLMAAAGAAEAAQLAESSEGPVARAAQLAQALRRAANPSYRTAVIEAGREGLERLGGDTVGLKPEDLRDVWVLLLQSAECLELETLPTLAEALVGGMIGKGGAAAMGPLAQVIGAALQLAPGGGSLVIQLIVTLTAGGEPKAAELLATELREVLHQARARCIPVLTSLRELRANPSSGGSEEALHRELEVHSPLLVALIPTCSRVLEKGQGIPQDAAPVLAEALLAVATLNIVSDTAAGQQLLRKTLLTQERGSETFLTTLPRAALTLAQPKLVRPLWDSGLTPAHFQFGGRPFLERVALYTGRAAVGPVLARTQKGDAATARVLLRSLVRTNAALFGLTPDGAYLAAEALEALREKPGRVSLKGTLYRMGKIRKKYSLGQHPGSIDPFQEVITALAGISVMGNVQRQAAAELIP
ncbi:MAG: hypothetical protein JXB05_04410 [Myxococcaceae bacterium]|nr:hypothetical protein [Myxococcaceae bacterium]